MWAIKKLALISLVALTTLSLVSCSEEETSLIDSALIYPEESATKTINAYVGDYENIVETDVYVSYDYSREFEFESDGYFEEYFVSQGDFVEVGDLVVSYITGGSSVTLEEKKLELERMEDDYDREIESYESELSYSTQILNALEEGSYEYQVQALNMEKDALEYEQYIYTTSRTISSLEEQIEELEDDLDVQYYYAEISGYVADTTYLSNGDIITKGDLAVEIITYDDILLRAEDSDVLLWGTEVEIIVGHNDSAVTLTGTVVASPSILSSDLSDTNCYIKVDFESSGTKATEINFSKTVSNAYGLSEYVSNVILLDKQAVTKESGLYYITILEDGVEKKRFISTTYNTLDYYWVVDGLDENDNVIIG